MNARSSPRADGSMNFGYTVETVGNVTPARQTDWIMNFEESKTNEYPLVRDKFDRLADGEARGRTANKEREREKRSTVDRVHKYRWKSWDIPEGFAIPRLDGSSVTSCNINVPREIWKKSADWQWETGRCGRENDRFPPDGNAPGRT